MNIVILGDIVNSRLIENRLEFGTDLRMLLERLSSKSLLLTQFSMMGIDQFVAVSSHARGLLDLILDLALGLYPYQVRIAIARGEIDVGLLSGIAQNMDGPAFHRAAAAIERIESQSDFLGFNGFGEALDAAVNAASVLLALSINAWSAKQRRVIVQVRKETTQVQAAEVLGITPQAVSDSLRSSRYRDVKRALAGMEKALLRVMQEKINGDS